MYESMVICVEHFCHDMSVHALAVIIFSYLMIGMQLPIASVFLHVTFLNF